MPRRSPFDPFVAAQGFVVLDGGFSTTLEDAGHDLNDPLWSAKVLLERPEAVLKVHRDFLRAGADCIGTATYQATFPGFAKRGLDEAEAEAVLAGAVDLALRARDEFWAEESNRAGRLRPLVAASAGPYGAYLADGSEYRGRYGISRAALETFHRRRWQILAESGADLVACETIPSLEEAVVLAELADRYGKPAWLSFSCPDGERLAGGESVARAAAVAGAASGVFAVGVNCVAPRHVPGLLAAFAAETAKPLVAYPNAGGRYDAVAKRWAKPERDTRWSDACRRWRAAGATAIGGCCRTHPSDIRLMRRALFR